jgi:glutathione S-transferase
MISMTFADLISSANCREIRAHAFGLPGRKPPMTRILHTLCGADVARPFSPHCWKVVMALAHKGLDFAEQPVSFLDVPKVEGGFAKLVPVLRDGDRLVSDSFDIALYLEETYPHLPTLFGGEGGKAAARFIEGYSQTIIHPAVSRIALLDIHAMLDDENRAYFRESREAAFGKPLEEVAADRDAEQKAFADKLRPLRRMLAHQSFIGGDGPLFADYIVFGALQWIRVTAGVTLFPDDDPVKAWFERCLDLHEARGRHVTAA